FAAVAGPHIDFRVIIKHCFSKTNKIPSDTKYQTILDTGLCRAYCRRGLAAADKKGPGATEAR
ncbi:MAG: hypothetical protein LBK98_04460, partial [Peptococcaceae bacterium]|nr:hypothetical protein [Peptococcaceae bacterium]